MEKKQLFNNSLVGFHPEIFDSYLQISVDIGDNNYNSNFTIDQTITVDDDFINNYNKTPVYSVGTLAINMTYNGDQTVRHLMSFVKGSEGSYANHIRDGFIYNISINNINTVDKTIDLTLISKNTTSSDLDNTIVHLTTTINGLANLNPGDFNETVTLTAEEYNAFNEIPIGKVFTLYNSDNAVYFTIKASSMSFRANRDYIDNNLVNRLLITVLIDLGENNQATFKGNVTKLMDFNNYLSKTNTTEYTPTNDYNPATKKYVDDSVKKVYRISFSSISIPDKSIINGNVDPSQYNFTLTSKELEKFNKISNGERVIINIDSDRNGITDTYVYAYLDGLSNDIQTVKVDRLYCSTNRVILTGCFNVDRTTGAGYWTNLNKLNAYTVITESEYAALGTTPNSDNVLYFITPD